MFTLRNDPPPPARAPAPDHPPGTAVERALTGLCLALTAALLVLWLPNYLRWPLFWDTEHFAQLAREWDAGLSRPYRDSFSYNWPGQIYLYWAGGKLLGWGKPLTVQLLDVLLLTAFGAWTLVWSRRCSGRLLPGAVALLGLLAFYMQCNFRYTGQRSWHAGLFAAAAVMVPQAWPGLRGGTASGFLLGLAMLFRPDIAVWGAGPLGVAVWRARGSGQPLRRAARAGLAWSSGLALALALGMLPLWGHGLLGDFLHAFRLASTRQIYDPQMVRAQTLGVILREIPRYEFLRPYALRFFLVGLPCLWAVAATRGGVKAAAHLAPWVWAIAASAVVSFRLPFFLEYLVLPIALAALLSLAPVLAALAPEFRRAPRLGVALIALLILFLVPGLPTYCDPGLARKTYAAALTGRRTHAAPVFLVSVYQEGDRRRKWDDYRACVRYLGKKLPKDLAVVNAVDPTGDYSALGVVYASGRRAGRPGNALILPTFPTPRFERALRSVAEDPGTAVVLTARQLAPKDPDAPPDEKLDRWRAQVVALVRERYRPAARCGGLEVWVRKEGGEAAAHASARAGAGARR